MDVNIVAHLAEEAATLVAGVLLESLMLALMLETEFLFEREPRLRTVFTRFIYLERPSSLLLADLEPDVSSDMLRTRETRDS